MTFIRLFYKQLCESKKIEEQRQKVPRSSRIGRHFTFSQKSCDKYQRTASSLTIHELGLDKTVSA